MRELITKTNNKIKIFTEDIDDSAVGFIRKLSTLESTMDNKIRIMPDCHPSKGSVVGLTMRIDNGKLIPGLLGNDIGCGVLAVKLKDKRIDLPNFDSVIRKRIPYGMNIRDKALACANRDLEYIKDRMVCNFNYDKISRSLGTLGGGNHFIELDKDSEGNIWLLIHSGSRNLGSVVNDYYKKLAYDHREENLPYDLCPLQGDDLQNYINDVKEAQLYAFKNRMDIASEICSYAKVKLDPNSDDIDIPHNYISDSAEGLILRKGAIASYKNCYTLIPLNMSEGTLLCKGKGNEDWNYSAPHGAGRKISRSEAKAYIAMKDYKASMEGIFSTSVNKDTIDECMYAYKPSNEIIDNIKETVEIVDRLKPIYNFKAGGNDDN